MKLNCVVLALVVSSLSLLAGCSNPEPAKNAASKPVDLSMGDGAALSDGTANGAANGEQQNKVGKFTPTKLENGEASHITVQHVLIGFKGSVGGKPITRSKAEAETLANEILAKAQAGEDFDALVRSHTDDSPPGIYHMANFNQDADMRNPIDDLKVYPRDGMVGAFGNVGFPLKVGEVGLANYDLSESKYGWHIIKRLK